MAIRPITVIIPTYNRARYLGRAVESALAQTGVRPEVIVVDDGSTDNTNEVLAPYRERIRYVYQPNRGPAAARNHGLRLGTADYVAFLDSDDQYLPGALATLHGELAARPQLGAVQGGIVLVDEGGARLGDQDLWHEAPTLNLETCLRHMPAKLMTMLVRREWAERIAGFDDALRWAEDIDFLIRLVAAGCTVGWVRRSIACYCRHDGNMSRDAVQGAKAVATVLDKYFARTDVEDALRQKEGSIRFYSLVWSAWSMWCSGETEHSVEWLRRSWAYTPYPPEQTVVEWVKQFSAQDVRVDRAASLQDWIPAMRVAAESVQVEWSRSEALLAWWARVWLQYLVPNYGGVEGGLAAYRGASTSVLVALAQDSLMMTPAAKRIAVIARFWSDARALGLVTASQRGAVAALYLSVFGQAALGGQPAIARRALARALRASTRPAAAGAWLRFAHNALAYGTRDIATTPHEPVRQ